MSGSSISDSVFKINLIAAGEVVKFNYRLFVIRIKGTAHRAYGTRPLRSDDGRQRTDTRLGSSSYDAASRRRTTETMKEDQKVGLSEIL